LHCTRPCTPGCSKCLEGFAKLGGRLAERGCRLLVALDEPDAKLRSLLGQMPAAARPLVMVGTWETGEPAHEATTLFAVIDPYGTVRELTRGPNVAPIPESEIIDHVNRALGGPRIELHKPAASAANGYGCVEWFDYDADPKRLRNVETGNTSPR